MPEMCLNNCLLLHVHKDITDALNLEDIAILRNSNLLLAKWREATTLALLICLHLCHELLLMILIVKNFVHPHF